MRTVIKFEKAKAEKELEQAYIKLLNNKYETKGGRK